MFTGGAVGRMAVFALGIMPYITYFYYHAIIDLHGSLSRTTKEKRVSKVDKK